MDGRNILTSDLEGKLKLWDIELGTLVKEFELAKDRLDDVAVVPPKGRYAVGSPGTAMLYFFGI